MLQMICTVAMATALETDTDRETMLQMICTVAMATALVMSSVKADCESPPSISNAVNNITGTPPYPDNLTVRYECKLGYNPAGTTSYYTCNDTVWTDGNFRCEKIFCSHIEPPENSRVVNTPTNEVGSSVKFVCNEGYDLSGDSMMVCRTDGNWLPSIPPICTAKDCGEFGPVQYADIFQDSSETERNRYGSIVEVTCTDGRVINGPSHVKCAENGQWDARPTCETIQCPPYPNTNASCVAKTQLAGNFYFMLCKEDISTRTGPDAAECKSGAWDSLGMACLCDCVIPEYDSNLISITSLNTFGNLPHVSALQWTCTSGSVKSFEDVICIDGKLNAVKDGSEVLLPNHSNTSDVNRIIMSKICILPTTESSTSTYSLLTSVSSESSEIYTPADISSVLTTNTCIVKKSQKDMSTKIVSTTSLPTLMSTTSRTESLIDIPTVLTENLVTKIQDISPTTVVLSTSESKPISVSSASSKAGPDLWSDISSLSVTNLLPSAEEAKMDSWTEEIATSAIMDSLTEEITTSAKMYSWTEEITTSAKMDSWTEEIATSAITDSWAEEITTSAKMYSWTEEIATSAITDSWAEEIATSAKMDSWTEEITTSAKTDSWTEEIATSAKMDSWTEEIATSAITDSWTEEITTSAKMDSWTEEITTSAKMDSWTEEIATSAITDSWAEEIATSAITDSWTEEITTSAITDSWTEEIATTAITDSWTEEITTSAITDSWTEEIATSAITDSWTEEITTSAITDSWTEEITTSAIMDSWTEEIATSAIKFVTRSEESLPVTGIYKTETSLQAPVSSISSKMDSLVSSKHLLTKSQIFNISTGISKTSATMVIKTTRGENKTASRIVESIDIPTISTESLVTQNQDISPTAVVLTTQESKPITLSSTFSETGPDFSSNISPTVISQMPTTVVIQSMTVDVEITSGTSALKSCLWFFNFFLSFHVFI